MERNMVKMNQYRTVIIGMGRMGHTRYENLMKHGRFLIEALCDVRCDNMKGFGVQFFEDWRACIDKVRPDVVFVCTVNAITPLVVCYALQKGCHVFAEKPPGRSLRDALSIRDCYVEHNNKILKFGFNHRYHNSVIEAKSLIDSGFLGKVIAARGIYGKAADYTRYEWRNDISIAGGGILLDQGIHMVDLLRYLVGEFIVVDGFARSLFWKDIAGEDTAVATLQTEDGKVATLYSTALQWKHKFDLDIICTNGYIALNGLLTSTKSYGEEKITYYQKDLENKSGKLGNPTEYTMCFDEDFSWMHEINEFYDALEGRSCIYNGTIDDAVAVMKILNDIYES